MSSDYPEEELPLDLEGLIQDAVKVALREQDAGRFLAWMRSHIYDYSTLGASGHDDLFDERAADHNDLLRSLGMVLGRNLWNAIPLPSNRYRPAPLPPPAPNDPCICGSGRQYKLCCGQLPQMPTPDHNDMWPLILDLLSPHQRQEAYNTGRVPAEMLGIKANELLEEGHPGKGRKLLEPLFDPEFTDTGEAHDFALNVLCNIYDALGFRQKKARLLQRITADAPRSALRSGAWQRLSAMRMDQGDSAGSWEAFRQAQRDDPGTSSLGVLEIQLLLSENRSSEARDRARMWLRQIRRSDLQDDMLTEFFEAVASDPHAAMVEIGMEMSGGAGEAVAGVLAGLDQRPLPEYRLVEAPVYAETGRTHYLLQAPEQLEGLEGDWGDVFPRHGLVAVEGAVAAMTDESPWDPETEALWTRWLKDVPRALDNLFVLDDIASALLEHPQANIPGWDERMLGPLLNRQCAILAQALEGRFGALDTVSVENQPAFRALMRRLELSLRHGDQDAMEQDARLLLRLDPTDEQGVRLLLLDHVLRNGRYDDVLALAHDYPDDDEPDLSFGSALALFCQGERALADDRLAQAMVSFPLVAPMLLNKSARVPRAHEDSGPGSPSQAWFYRESALDLWQETPGALDWLGQARQ